MNKLEQLIGPKTAAAGLAGITALLNLIGINTDDIAGWFAALNPENLKLLIPAGVAGAIGYWLRKAGTASNQVVKIDMADVDGQLEKASKLVKRLRKERDTFKAAYMKAIAAADENRDLDLPTDTPPAVPPEENYPGKVIQVPEPEPNKATAPHTPDVLVTNMLFPFVNVGMSDTELASTLRLRHVRSVSTSKTRRVLEQFGDEDQYLIERITDEHNRGLVTNNPGNINATPLGKNAWFGEVKSPDRYARFVHPWFGLRAMAYELYLNSYRRDGFNTVHKIIADWAPHGDNNPVQNYVNYVVIRMNGHERKQQFKRPVGPLVSADKPFEMTRDMLYGLMEGIILFENTRVQPYAPELIYSALDDVYSSSPR